MKRTLLGLAIISLSCNALANDLYPTGFYIGGKIGGSIVHPEKIKHADNDFGSYTKGAFVGGVMAGYDFSYDFDIPVRAELEYSMRTHAKKNVDSNGTEIQVKTRFDTLLANFYYDFYTGTAFTPYINAGLGVAFDKLKIDDNGTESNKNKTRFAWEVGLGSSYNFTDALSADFSVRFVDAGKVKHGEPEDSAKIIATDIMLGIRYAF